MKHPLETTESVTWTDPDGAVWRVWKDARTWRGDREATAAEVAFELARLGARDVAPTNLTFKATNLTFKATVLTRYPDATAQQTGNRWYVHIEQSEQPRAIGSGAIEAKAWQDAAAWIAGADRLKADLAR